MKNKSLLEMARGQIMERVDYEVMNVLVNIADPNTDPKKARKLTLTAEFKPSADRQSANIFYKVTTKLEPTNAIENTLYLMADKNGELSAVEAVPNVPGQVDFNGGTQEEPAQLRRIK